MSGVSSNLSRTVKNMASKFLRHSSSLRINLPLSRYPAVRCGSVGPVTSSSYVRQKEEPEQANTANSIAQLTFDNSRESFRSKTSLELIRALVVFRLCSVEFLVEKNQQASVFI